MLAKNIDSKLFAESSESVKGDRVRPAFRYPIGIEACQRQFECEIRWKGEVRDFRFFNSGGEQPFSFTTNQEWLLFYFRPPAMRSNPCSIVDTYTVFESFVENSAGEWTVKIRNIDDVDQRVHYLGWTR